jgi:multiple sugar transport system permease protein
MAIAQTAIEPSVTSMAERREPVRRFRRSQNFGVLKGVGLYFVLTVTAAVFMVPYLLTLFASLKTNAQIYNQPPWSLPSHLEFSNYSTTLISQNFLSYLGNTALVTAVLTIGQVFCSMICAFAFARLKFPGREAIFWLYLLTLMVPNIVTVIPLYIIMREGHLLNTYWALFLPYVFGSPYVIFLMRQFFRSIPQEVIDAGHIDGCTNWGVLRRIVVPMSRPVIITATIIAFVFSWNNFLWPLIATNSQSHFVLTTGLANFQSNFGVQWNLLLAGAMITLLPLIIIFIIFQKHVVRSIQLSTSR